MRNPKQEHDQEPVATNPVAKIPRELKNLDTFFFLQPVSQQWNDQHVNSSLFGPF